MELPREERPKSCSVSKRVGCVDKICALFFGDSDRSLGCEDFQ